ncbi:MAG TPA: protein-L-isoaspartate(D-aspartate) O-methyltransferase [Saprospiraceae bacterium]|nr:protein-L-isoaspartate(D-aspartate) O-methyltransferase [Saprospiraceae bacterium]HNT19012.1 protein-L-isoaspartate(D-aspartate) O-methyltransferase [Saprospiraceae bacterium]
MNKKNTTATIAPDHGRLEDNHWHRGLRKKMVEDLRHKGIKDEKVLQAMLRVPRHFFVPKGFESWAYRDVPFPIGSDQTISQPYTVAFQTALLDIRPGERVLEIGTGSGYQAAVLFELGAKVYTLERQEKLYHQTASFLKKMQYLSVRCYLRDGFEGLPKYAPYDKILVTCGAPELPQNLLDQLTPGGCLVIPMGDGEDQVMKKITKKSDGEWEEEAYGVFRFVPFLKGLNKG